MDNIGVYLPDPVFGHGQLYVIFSRVRDFKNINMLIIEGEEQGLWDSNMYYTHNIVYQELLTSVDNDNMNVLLPIEYDMDIDDNESICSETSLLDSEYSDSDSVSIFSDNDNEQFDMND